MLNRREVIRAGAGASAAVLLGGVPVFAKASDPMEFASGYEMFGDVKVPFLSAKFRSGASWTFETVQTALAGAAETHTLMLLDTLLQWRNRDIQKCIDENPGKQVVYWYNWLGTVNMAEHDIIGEVAFVDEMGCAAVWDERDRSNILHEPRAHNAGVGVCSLPNSIYSEAGRIKLRRMLAKYNADAMLPTEACAISRPVPASSC